MVSNTWWKRKIVWLMCQLWWRWEVFDEQKDQPHVYIAYVEKEFLDEGFWRA